MTNEEAYAKYFKSEKDAVVFTGDKLEIFLPERYTQHGCLEIGDEVTTLAIFDMTVNDTIKCGLMLPAKVVIRPTDVTPVTKPNGKFFKLTLVKNDVFLKNTIVVQDAQLAYIIFYEMIYSGKVPDFITYEEAATIFDGVIDVAGVKFPSDHVVFEMMTAMLHRDVNDVSKQYRHSDMEHPPMNVPMRLVSIAAISTTARILGSYMDDGIDSSMVNAANTNSEIENLLRQ